MSTRIWIGTVVGHEGDASWAANWSGAAVPINADDVVFENSAQDLNAGLNMSAVALASLISRQTYTGKIGTTTAYWQIGTAKLEIGSYSGPGSPVGSGRIKIDLGSATACVAVVYNTGYGTDTDLPAVRLLAANAATTLEVRKGQVGVAMETAETSTISLITVSYDSAEESDADVFIGSGVTLTTLTKTGGECICKCAATTITNRAGTLIIDGVGAVTTLAVTGGTVYPNSSGTIGTLDIDGGLVDCTKSSKARTITTVTLDAPGQLKYDPAVMTFTNKVNSSKPVTLMAA